MVYISRSETLADKSSKVTVGSQKAKAQSTFPLFIETLKRFDESEMSAETLPFDFRLSPLDFCLLAFLFAEASIRIPWKRSCVSMEFECLLGRVHRAKVKKQKE